MLFVTGAHVGLKGPFRQRGLLGVRYADVNETTSLGEGCGAVKKVWDVALDATWKCGRKSRD